MSYKYYNFNMDDCKKYKGIRYWKFNQEYIIQFPDNTRVKRFSIKDVKICINEFLNDSKYSNGWAE